MSAPLTYREARVELLRLATEAAAVINQFPPEKRETLHALMVDDLYELAAQPPYDAKLLWEAFARARDGFLERIAQVPGHSVRVDARPVLRVVGGKQE